MSSIAILEVSAKTLLMSSQLRKILIYVFCISCQLIRIYLLRAMQSSLQVKTKDTKSSGKSGEKGNKKSSQGKSAANTGKDAKTKESSAKDLSDTSNKKDKKSNVNSKSKQKLSEKTDVINDDNLNTKVNGDITLPSNAKPAINNNNNNNMDTAHTRQTTPESVNNEADRGDQSPPERMASGGDRGAPPGGNMSVIKEAEVEANFEHLEKAAENLVATWTAEVRDTQCSVYFLIFYD